MHRRSARVECRAERVNVEAPAALVSLVVPPDVAGPLARRKRGGDKITVQHHSERLRHVDERRARRQTRRNGAVLAFGGLLRDF